MNFRTLYFPLSALRSLGPMSELRSAEPPNIGLIAPSMDGKLTERPGPLGIQSGKQVAPSDNRYKIHSGDGGKIFALYDLIDDPGESTDLSSEKPEFHHAMIETATAWRESCKVSDAGEDYR